MLLPETVQANQGFLGEIIMNNDQDQWSPPSDPSLYPSWLHWMSPWSTLLGYPHPIRQLIYMLPIQSLSAPHSFLKTLLFPTTATLLFGGWGGGVEDEVFLCSPRYPRTHRNPLLCLSSWELGLKVCHTTPFKAPSLSSPSPLSSCLHPCYRVPLPTPVYACMHVHREVWGQLSVASFLPSILFWDRLYLVSSGSLHTPG